MIFNIFKGFGYAIKGMKIISQSKIRRFVIIPLSINIVLFVAAIAVLFSRFDQWMQSFLPSFPDWLSWLEAGIMWLIWPLFAVTILFLVFYSFSFVANLIAAPFNSLLAEKVECMLKDQSLDATPSYPVLSVVKKSLASEIAKLFYLLKWSIILVIISLVPVVNIIAPPLWIIFGAWMLALEYLDYPMGNHEQYFKDINDQALAKKSLSFGYGTGVLLLISIPVINFIAMPAAVAGATALYVKERDNL